MDVPVKIAVTHGDAIVAAGLRAILASSEEIVSNDADATIVVTDRQRGMALVASVQPAPVRVLVVAERDGAWEIRQAIEAGVHGYLLQSATPDQLLAAVHALGQGSDYITPGLLPAPAAGQRLVTLTRREQDVLRLLAQGCGNKLIARELDIGLGTVKTHNKQLYTKLGAASRTHAVLLARRQGLIGG